ncbi:MAG TPA: ABC transporter ATP-binding protein [Geobacteraceae bacterium]
MDAIITDNLTKRFDAVTAVDGVSLCVAPGELFGLIGPDGAGKTTILRMLASIMEPTAGTARVMERDIVADAEAIKKEIGYMSQRFGLYPDLTVLENIHFYADIFSVPLRGRAERIEELLAFSNLTPFKKRRAGNLSGGMKQKLGLACALVHTPRVLFLDEPTNGVDPVSRRDFWRILYRLLKEGVTIFVTTAYLDEADRCHRVGLIHKGRLLACDTPEGLKRLMEGVILEVRTDNARRAAGLLRTSYPSASVGLFGDRVHITCNDAEKMRTDLEQCLKREGVEILGIRQVEPSLEDVFVSVLAGEKEVGAHGA